MDKEKSSLGVVLGVALATLISSGALSSWIGGVQADEKGESITEHLDKDFKPQVEDAFASIDDDLDALDEELVKCRTEVRQVKITADAALYLIEKRMNARTVERAVAKISAEDDNDPPPKPAHDKRPRVKLKEYMEQKAVK
jgi:hypothetical protein